MHQACMAILLKLVAEQGKEALLNSAKCKSFLVDYTHGDHKKESRLLLQALEAGSAKAIDSATDPDLGLCKQRQVKTLREEYFLAEEIAKDLVDTLALALRGDSSRTEAPDGAGNNNKTIPQNPMYYICHNNQEKGPYKKPAIKAMITKGQITAEYYVRSADGFQWEPITALFEFPDVSKAAIENPDTVSFQSKISRKNIKMSVRENIVWVAIGLAVGVVLVVLQYILGWI